MINDYLKVHPALSSRSSTLDGNHAVRRQAQGATVSGPYIGAKYRHSPLGRVSMALLEAPKPLRPRMATPKLLVARKVGSGQRSARLPYALSK
jgi:hypothetical protein